MCTGQSDIQFFFQAHAIILREAATTDPEEAELPIKIVILDNVIVKGDYELSNKIPKDMLESEKTAYVNDWHIC